MKTQQSTINDFFAITNTMFSIPVYQRNYTWSKDNCAKLLEDIINISKNEKTHFMGSITYILHFIDDDEKQSLRKLQEFVIIDGQQRITTLMLLLKAIETRTQDESIKDEISRLLGLPKKQTETQKKLRLKPLKRDKEAFDLVMQNRWTEIQGKSHIRENYKFFLKELDDYLLKGYSIEEIYGAFLRLKIVGIGLEISDDDPQVVFESINATGEPLTGLDLIRNYLMMGENSAKQQELYDTYWIPLEEWLGVNEKGESKNLSEFILTYLRIYYEDKVKEGEREIYHSLKAHHREHFPDDIEALMRDMREYGRIYQVFLEGHQYGLEQPNATAQQLANLRKLVGVLVSIKFGVAKPFVLRLARDFEEDRLDYENFYEILQILISYYVRRSVCGEPTPVLNRILYSLYSELNGEISADMLKRYLGKNFDRGIFPNDDRITTAFATRNAYSLRNICKFILLEIEKLSNAEPPREEELQVEHFYPQSATQEWRDMVGDYYTFEQDYLNNFGNLTLTGQNLKLSNKPYEEKIELMEKNGSLHLNDYFINNTDSWGIDEMLARSGYLAQKFCEVEMFRDLPKEYRTRELSKSLDDDLTFHKFSSITLPNGQRHFVRNASYLAKSAIEYLLENAREAFESYTSDELPSCIYWDSSKASARRRDGTLVVPFGKAGFYFVSNAALRDVGKNLKRLIIGCGLNPREFIID